MRSKAIVVCCTLIAAVGLGSLAANPQNLPQQNASSPDLSSRKDDKLYIDRLTRKLKLTPNQQAKLEPIVKDEGMQIEAVRRDDTLSTEQRHARIARIRAATKPQIEAILTPDRQKKFAALKEEDDR